MGGLAGAPILHISGLRSLTIRLRAHPGLPSGTSDKYLAPPFPHTGVDGTIDTATIVGDSSDIPITFGSSLVKFDLNGADFVIGGSHSHCYVEENRPNPSAIRDVTNLSEGDNVARAKGERPDAYPGAQSSVETGAGLQPGKGSVDRRV
ncbi:hypothetical protein BEWA_049170 [Theileria equi strain WA]|uniref:Uncharacterized protein n=1 Tax=Theileria equi strain WA TaxID=1537102 RepID=L1LAZ3_THEEQ|nr:hypothetical protein BEWA_049170 [Theileria equi strain WA]EKX72450.1 hypothetical protein BEWA_049170 [Theileria equi strain WA]|eukprot:XP_004831902.1 hypothetical protein BEWA_049170 [Theileria equi strain WA]